MIIRDPPFFSRWSYNASCCFLLPVLLIPLRLWWVGWHCLVIGVTAWVTGMVGSPTTRLPRPGGTITMVKGCVSGWSQFYEPAILLVYSLRLLELLCYSWKTRHISTAVNGLHCSQGSEPDFWVLTPHLLHLHSTEP